MVSGDNASSLSRQYDFIVVGGGIIGCWIAYKAGLRGIRTLLLERSAIGAGASGGLLGALMPHMPERWDGKKQFQFEALTALPDEIASLEAQTAMQCGYRMCGRLAPIMNATKRGQMEQYARGVAEFWGDAYDWQVLDHTPHQGWPDAGKATHGVVYDSLSARISPRGVLKALKQALIQSHNVTLVEGLGVSAYDADRAIVKLKSGDEVTYGHLALAAGVETFDFIAPALSVATKALGKAVKGQTALLKADCDPSLPIMFDNGLYAIVHDDGNVAVGSTSELDFECATTTDNLLDQRIAQARATCPILREAQILARWAGVRPRAIGRDPLLDVMSNHRNIIIATSGFKISFGIAHKMADVVVEHVRDSRTTPVPESFKLASHLAKARRAQANQY